MKRTISGIILLFSLSVSEGLGMEAIAPEGKSDEIKQPTSVQADNHAQPTQLYPPVIPPEQQLQPNGDLQPLPADNQQPPPPPPPPINPGFSTRVYNFMNKSTSFVDTAVTTPISNVPGIHIAYTKFPLTTKLVLLGLVGFWIYHTDFCQKAVNKVRETMNNLIGNSSDILDEDNEEDDDEVDKPVYNNKLFMRKL